MHSHGGSRRFESCCAHHLLRNADARTHNGRVDSPRLDRHLPGPPKLRKIFRTLTLALDPWYTSVYTIWQKVPIDPMSERHPSELIVTGVSSFCAGATHRGQLGSRSRLPWPLVIGEGREDFARLSVSVMYRYIHRTRHAPPGLHVFQV